METQNASNEETKFNDQELSIKSFLNNYDISIPFGPRNDQSFDFFEQQNKKWIKKWPLHYAAMTGNIEDITNLCLKNKINPNQMMTDWYDSEPLGWAASFCQLTAVIELIKYGADPFRPPNKANNTPHDDALRERHEPIIMS